MQDAELKSKAKGPQSGYVARQQDPHPNGIPKPKARTGFSLIEVLAAMAVVLVLTALLFPAFASAKLAAEKADTSSKLHQCVLALNQYVQDYGDGNGIPSRDQALRVIPPKLLCDKADYWRTSCQEDWPPLLGSFGYLGSDPYTVKALKRGPLPAEQPVLVSIFYSSPHVTSFHGNIDDGTNPHKGYGLPNYDVPDHVLVARWDGSVHWQRTYSPGPHYGLNWTTIWEFLNPNTPWIKVNAR